MVLYYSSTFSRTDTNNLNSVFVDNFPASTDYYNLLFKLSSQTNNNIKQIDENESTEASDITVIFYVDDYSMNPIPTWELDPSLSVTGTTTLFGIPSVSSITLKYSFNVSNFASHIIPTSGTDNVHSYVAAISKNAYSFDVQNKTGLINNAYTITFNGTDNSITNGTYDDNTSDDVQYVFTI